RICYLAPRDTQICAPGQEICYLKSWDDGSGSIKGKRLEFGCAATCPTVKPGIDIKCCSTDKCNPHPKLA
uniref:Alpha-elapitoxin-Lc2c n=1 Tax=Laticauda colubrina TaxID=8628 RepID=3L21_LATCO|nr:RecName: Full=Alpha-elapitoxin-Lc2c; Short=Alpha-EPTX-Lc2c; AltName: Full=Long neurotoxin 1 [Laticauda colubrina]